MEHLFKEIIAPGGRSFLLDVEDIQLLDGLLYFVRKHGDKYYVTVREHGVANRNKEKALHRIILNMNPGERVDFRNLNTLDLRKSNIRSCSYAEKNCHVRKKRNTKRFKGVFCDARRGLYYAQLAIGGIRYYGGSFTTEEEAAEAYDSLAIKYHREFALTNFEDDNHGKR